ncbi:MAG: molybdopterin biosynthesis protein [Thermodesulfovibrionales bacterium]
MRQIFFDSVSLERAGELFSTRLDSLGIQRLPSEQVRVVEAQDRITAEPVFAKYSSPFYHSAAMDGYAVRYADTFTASETSPCLLRIGRDALYVDTGDPMPEGFTAVIMVEDANLVRGQEPQADRPPPEDAESTGDGAPPDCIEIYQSVPPYQHVRSIGEDIVATELIIPEGHRIRPVDIGALLAGGHLEVAVRRSPVVAVLPTGTELVEPELLRDRPPAPPEIIEYNSAVLGGLSKELGAAPLRFPIVRDDPDAIKEALLRAVERADLVLINAGSGRGSEDYTLAAIQELGEAIVHGVSIKPGKPVIIGFIRNKPVVGIPGYPVSAYLAFTLFVRPVIERFLGTASAGGERITARLARQIASPLGIDEFIRVKVGEVNNTLIAAPVGRGAGLMMSLVRADGIVRIPAGSEGMRAGSEVEVELLRSGSEVRNTVVCIGSHDNTLDILANIVKKSCPRYSLSSAHVGSLGGLMALKKGEAHLAGTHLLDEQTGEYNVPFLKRLFPDRRMVLVNLVRRRQGLLVRRGNPKGIQCFEDLVRDDVLFINRQAGSGTRLLLDKHLRELNINPFLIRGYDKEEYTHMSVASAVLTGLADTGLAVFSSARALGLDFIPVAEERYDLAIPYEFMDTEKIGIVLGIIRGNAEFRALVQALGGYDTQEMGVVMYEG